MSVRAWCPNCQKDRSCTELIPAPIGEIMSLRCDDCRWRFNSYYDEIRRPKNDVTIEVHPRESNESESLVSELSGLHHMH